MRKLINVGYGNSINSAEIIAVINANTKPAKKTIKDARDKDLLIDVSEGNKICSAVIMKSGHVVLSVNKPETLKGRMNE